MSKYKYYYHITALENVDLIKKKGLKVSTDKHINLFTELHIKNWVFNFDVYLPDIIASRQMLAHSEKYCILTIDAKGITNKIKFDNVDKDTNEFQRKVKQELINPEYIINYENRVLDLEHVYKWKELDLLKLFTGYSDTELDSAKLYKTGELPLGIGDKKKILKKFASTLSR